MSAPAEVFPPGGYIREELEARGWTPTDLAWVMGVHASVLSALLSGRRGISAEMSKKLGDAFDVSPELFANLQAAADGAAEWNEKSGDPDVLAERLCRFFGAKD